MDNIIKTLNTSDDTYNVIESISIDELEKTIEYSSTKYYNSTPVISDGIFDMLVDFLRLKKPKSKILKLIGAPVKSKDKVKLPFYLGSMDKIKPPSNKLEQWKDKYSSPYIMMDKLDGVSGLLVYSNNKVRLYTRGTATHGMDISILLNYIPQIPTYDIVMKKFKGQTVVAFRGELIISKTKFEKKWAIIMKNARNAVAGLVNSKTIDPTLAHDTHFVVYQVVSPVLTMSEQLVIINSLDFKTVHSKLIDKLNYDILSAYLLKRRDKSKYIIDGIIVTNDKVHSINVKGNPEYSFAFKDILEDQKALTTVTNIEWNESKDGYLIPTIIVNSVDIGGVTIKRITGNNAKFIMDNMIGIGSKVEIIRSNDVIPKIEKIITKVTPILPTNKKWKWSETHVHIISTEKHSNDMMIKNIYHFFSILDTVGLGEKNIEKIYNAGYTSIDMILQMTKEDIIKIDGFKEKSASNIIESIKKSTNSIPQAQLMVASNKLGHGIGLERVKNILLNHNDIITNSNKYENISSTQFVKMLKQIEGFDEIISKMFVENYTKFIEFYNSIKNYITINTSIKKPTGNILLNKHIVISGFRDKHIIDIIAREGGELGSTTSKKTDILIIKDITQNETSKVIKAKDLGIKIYTIDTFLKKYNLK